MTEAGQKKHRRRHQVKEVEPAVSFKDVSLRDVDEESEDNYMEDNKDAREHSVDWDDNDREGRGSRFSPQAKGGVKKMN